MKLTLEILKGSKLTALSRWDRTLLTSRLVRGKELFIERDGSIKDSNGFKIARIKHWEEDKQVIR